MNILEKIATSLRHSQFLEKNEQLWNWLRPTYNSFIGAYGKKGLKRVINGTDSILVVPEFRGVSEVYEPDVWHDLMSNLLVGDSIVDVGSYIGLYSIAIAKRVTNSGKVFAFEPDPKNFQSLKLHIALNQVTEIVESINMAVADKSSVIHFQAERDSQSSIATTATGNTISVNCTSLDKYFPNTKIDLLKIDVEGWEEKVLEGASLLLSDKNRSPRLIYIEVHPFAWKEVGTSWDSLINLLSKYNYKISTLDNIPPTSINWWGEIIAQKQN